MGVSRVLSDITKKKKHSQKMRLQILLGFAITISMIHCISGGPQRPEYPKLPADLQADIKNVGCMRNCKNDCFKVCNGDWCKNSCNESFCKDICNEELSWDY